MIGEWFGAWRRAPRGESLASHDGYDNYVFWEILTQDFGAFLHRGASGENIIDKNHPLSLAALDPAASTGGYLNCAAQIL